MRSSKPLARLKILFNDRRFRSWCIQAFVLIILACGIGYGVYNTAYNLQRAGVTTGFEFLGSRSGFDISQTLVEYSGNSSYSRALLVGILNTLLVSGLAIVSSTILGFSLGIIRLSPNWLMARMAEGYTEMIRNIPLLLQILFWYLAVLSPLPGPRQAYEWGDMFFLCNRGMQIPKLAQGQNLMPLGIALIVAVLFSWVLIAWNRYRQRHTGQRFPAVLISLGLIILLPLGVQMATGRSIQFEMPVLRGFNFVGGITVLPELIALWLALTLYSATFIGEYVRSGIMAVDSGQKEAAHALGHRGWTTYWLIIIPQAMRATTPPLISQYLTLVKNSSLAVVIGYPDLVHVFAGTALNQSGQAVEIVCITMAVYLIISLVISLFMNWYNKKFALRGL
ncbi:MAG: ABC transporter permease subunit [Desulfobacter sp.]|nr:ABC transporter permease subunit [Desulfobacter sp.]